MDWLRHREEPSPAEVREVFLGERLSQPCQGRGLGRKATRGVELEGGGGGSKGMDGRGWARSVHNSPVSSLGARAPTAAPI